MNLSKNGTKVITKINTEGLEEMILTVTLNPAIDISYRLDELDLNTVNRVSEVSKTAGGKGLNVSRVLALSGERVIATGFYGGPLASQIHQELDALEIKDGFVEIAGKTRNNIAILHQKQQTEILEAGPAITLDEVERFLEYFSEVTTGVSVVSISGSLPKGVPTDFYTQLIERASHAGAKVILDSSGEAFSKALKAKPHIIKPNHEEIADLLGVEKTHNQELLKGYLENPLFDDISLIMLSLGSQGALVKADGDFYFAQIPKVNAKNAVGSGDSTVAGLAAGLLRGYEYIPLIKHAMTLGVLNALQEQTGFINMTDYDEIYSQVNVEKL